MKITLELVLVFTQMLQIAIRTVPNPLPVFLVHVYVYVRGRVMVINCLVLKQVSRTLLGLLKFVLAEL